MASVHTPLKGQNHSSDIPESPRALSSNPVDQGTSSSSLYHINSQLVAHGFTKSPLELGGLSEKEQGHVIKVLFGMLQQRVDDLANLETIQTSHRTQVYDLSRLTRMYQSSLESVSKAEKESMASLAKLNDVKKLLKEEKESHKGTKDDLQKTKTALLFVRNQAQHDLKKKEQELAKITDRFSASKLQSTNSWNTLICLNPAPFPSTSSRTVRDQNLAALEELDRSRKVAERDSDNLRRLVEAVYFELKQLGKDVEGSHSTASSSKSIPLFHPQSKVTPQIQLDSALKNIRVGIRQLQQKNSSPSSSTATAPSSDYIDSSKLQESYVKKQKEIEVLKGKVDQLEMESARRDEEFVRESQKLMEEFNSNLVLAPLSGQVDLIDHKSEEEIQSNLDHQRALLDAERQNFTEAAVQLGKERAEMEAERLKFFEEKRATQLTDMLADLPPTPDHHQSSGSCTSLNSPATTSQLLTSTSPTAATSSGRNNSLRSPPAAVNAVRRGSSHKPPSNLSPVPSADEGHSPSTVVFKTRSPRTKSKHKPTSPHKRFPSSIGIGKPGGYKIPPSPLRNGFTANRSTMNQSISSSRHSSSTSTKPAKPTASAIGTSSYNKQSMLTPGALKKRPFL